MHQKKNQKQITFRQFYENQNYWKPFFLTRDFHKKKQTRLTDYTYELIILIDIFELHHLDHSVVFSSYSQTANSFVIIYIYIYNYCSWDQFCIYCIEIIISLIVLPIDTLRCFFFFFENLSFYLSFNMSESALLVNFVFVRSQTTTATTNTFSQLPIYHNSRLGHIAFSQINYFKFYDRINSLWCSFYVFFYLNITFNYS